MENVFFVRQGGKKYGPITREKLLLASRQNKLSADALLSSTGADPWLPAESVLSTLLPDEECVSANRLEQSDSDASPEQVEQIANPVQWYFATFGHQWKVVQLALWLAYGFIWIPLAWLIWGRGMTRQKAGDLVASDRLPLLSYCALALLIVSIASFGLFATIDPEGYQKWRAEVAAARAASQAQREQAQREQARPTLNTAKQDGDRVPVSNAQRVSISKLKVFWKNLVGKKIRMDRLEFRSFEPATSYHFEFWINANGMKVGEWLKLILTDRSNGDIFSQAYAYISSSGELISSLRRGELVDVEAIVYTDPKGENPALVILSIDRSK